MFKKKNRRAQCPLFEFIPSIKLTRTRSALAPSLFGGSNRYKWVWAATAHRRLTPVSCERERERERERRKLGVLNSHNKHTHIYTHTHTFTHTFTHTYTHNAHTTQLTLVLVFRHSKPRFAACPSTSLSWRGKRVKRNVFKTNLSYLFRSPLELFNDIRAVKKTAWKNVIPI